MIRTEQEYQEVRKRIQQDREFAQLQREALEKEGLTPEEVERAMQPLLSFQAQLIDEMIWYENVIRGHFSPTNRWTDTGRVIIALRISKGWTQKEFARRLGVSEAQVSRDERNEYHGITLERAQRIFDVLDVNVMTTIQEAAQYELVQPQNQVEPTLA